MEPETSEEHPSGPPPSKRHRKKVNCEWSDESVLKLIAAVEPHEILWNPALKDYRNRGLRDTIWKSISEDTLGEFTTMEEVVEKWGNLRIQFKSYESKKKKSKSGQGSVDIKSSWKYYQHMSFLSGAGVPLHGASLSNLVGIVVLSVCMYVSIHHVCTSVLVKTLNANISKLDHHEGTKNLTR